MALRFSLSSPTIKVTPSSLLLLLTVITSSSFAPSHALPHSTNGSTGLETVRKTVLSNKTGAIIGALILTLVFLLGVPGNLFIIWSVLARARRRSVTTLLILNLASADGTLMVLTPFFIVYLVMQRWIFGLAICKIIFYLCCSNMYASIFLITLMSLHRLVAVVWPRRVGALTGRKTVVRVVLGAWLMALLLSVPVLVFRNLPKQNTSIITCECHHEPPKYAALQYSLETLLGFLLPYGVIIGSYVCILRRIRQTRFRRRLRSEKLILAIVITFGLFWLPYHMINMVQVAAALCPETLPAKKRLDTIWRSYRVLTSTLAFISSCVNPILYTLAGKSYIRREGLAFMARLFEGTALDGTRRGRSSDQNSRDKDRDKDAEAKGLQTKESDSVTSADATSNLRVAPVRNGK